MKVPKRAQVERAIRGVRRQLRSTLKAVNQQAGKLLGRGRYGEAEELVRIGRAIDGFQVKVEELQREWRSATGPAKGRAGPEAEEATPMWRFYHPIVKALLAAGGTANQAELEHGLPPFLEGQVTPADMTAGPRGVLRWKVMLRRARRPMIKEGFLEPARGKRWQLSPEGRRLAQGEPPAEGLK